MGKFPGTKTTYLEALGDTVIDFDFAPPEYKENKKVVDESLTLPEENMSTFIETSLPQLLLKHILTTSFTRSFRQHLLTTSSTRNF